MGPLGLRYLNLRFQVTQRTIELKPSALHAKEGREAGKEGYLCMAALICRTDSYISIISQTGARLRSAERSVL